MRHSGDGSLTQGMKRTAVLACLALAVVVLRSPSVAAAQDLEGLPIQSIEYRGLERLAEDSLNFYLGLEVDGGIISRLPEPGRCGARFNGTFRIRSRRSSSRDRTRR